MQHPTSQQVRKVIGLLTSVLPMATREEHLDMSEGFINTAADHVCGTTNYHGGWYVIANNMHYRKRKHLLFFDVVEPVGGLNFNDGATLMANHLGLGQQGQLLDWAK